MSTRSAVIDGDRPYKDLRYFFADAQSVGHARRTGLIDVADSHYGGPLAEATVYILNSDGNEFRTLESLRLLFGCGALSPIRSLHE